MAKIIYAVAGEGFGHSLGISSDKLDEVILARFLDELDKPMPSDERIIWPDNDKFFRLLQEVLNKLHNPISIKLS